MKAMENRAGTCVGQHQGAAMNKGNTESHAETRSSRRESDPPTSDLRALRGSALSAAPREKKSGWETKTFGNVRKRGQGTEAGFWNVFQFWMHQFLFPELSKGLRNLNGLLPRN